MFLKRYINILKTIVSLTISRSRTFLADTLIGLFTNIIFVVANVLFWLFVFRSGYNIGGWSLSDIIVFLAFSELFFGIDNAIFKAASRFWYYIVSGMLDIHLTRPFDPRLRFILFNISYTTIIKTIIVFITLLLIANAKLNIILVLIGVIIVIIANVILAFITSVLNYLSFIFGRLDAVSEISDSMVMFNKYPLVVMPKGLIYIFKFTLPFFFFSTFSAELVTSKLTSTDLIISISGLILCLCLWYLLNKYFWRKGLSRYESYNG